MAYSLTPLGRTALRRWKTAYPRLNGCESGFRFFSSGMGRWLNRDPIEESGGLGVYACFSNDPADGTDLVGLSSLCLGTWAGEPQWDHSIPQVHPRFIAGGRSMLDSRIPLLIPPPTKRFWWVSMGFDRCGRRHHLAPGVLVLLPSNHVISHVDNRGDVTNDDTGAPEHEWVAGRRAGRGRASG